MCYPDKKLLGASSQEWNYTLAERKCSCHRNKPSSFAHATFEPSCQISGPLSSRVLDSNSFFFSSLHSLDETADVSVKFCSGKDDHIITPVHRFAYVLKLAYFGLFVTSVPWACLAMRGKKLKNSVSLIQSKTLVPTIYLGVCRWIHIRIIGGESLT